MDDVERVAGVPRDGGLRLCRADSDDVHHCRAL
jgi:hypothetical protein